MHEIAGSLADGVRTAVDRDGGPDRLAAAGKMFDFYSLPAERILLSACCLPKGCCSLLVACRKDVAGVFRSFFNICTPVSALRALFPASEGAVWAFFSLFSNLVPSF